MKKYYIDWEELKVPCIILIAILVILIILGAINIFYKQKELSNSNTGYTNIQNSHEKNESENLGEINNNEEKIEENLENEEHDEIEKRVYNISFNKDNGEKLTKIEVEEGSKIEAPAIPYKKGYKLLYWQSNNKKFNFNTEVNNDITLKAVWKSKDSICKESIKTKNLTGMHGVAMVSKSIYEDTEYNKKNEVATPGHKFKILGENDKFWIVDYNGSCGIVDSTYMAINLKEYIPTITYSIKNRTGSYIKGFDGTNTISIEGLTGKTLYSSEYNDFVPATFSLAKKLKIAQDNAIKGGDSLVVYDAYRPVSVSSYSLKKLQEEINRNPDIAKYINESYDNGEVEKWGAEWFLATNLSKHNTGCAVDVTLKGKESYMPTAYDEISTRAIKYYKPGSKEYSSSFKNSQSAQDLANYMMNGTGLVDLASEWWHFQDNVCHTTIAKGANFWSAI